MTKDDLSDLLRRCGQDCVMAVTWQSDRATLGRIYTVAFYVPNEPKPETELKFQPADER